jgi:RNA polymerase sigma factor (sigma-70 family)
VTTAAEGDPAGPRSEDDAILAGYLRGDAPAVAAVDGWIAAAASPFRRRLGADWPDLQQEARIEILRLLRASSWRGEARLRTYVWRVVGHTCLDALRRQRRRPAGEPEEQGAEIASGAPSPLDGLLAQDAGRILLTALRALPEECRELWTRILRGASYGEMSRELGVTEGALRVRAHRCRKRALEALAGNASAAGAAQG